MTIMFLFYFYLFSIFLFHVKIVEELTVSTK